MNISTKLVYFETKEQFNKLLSNLNNTSVVFIEDSGELWTHGKVFGGVLSDSTIDKITITLSGTSVEVSKYGHKHDSLYVTSLGTDGNYLTWTKNGTVNKITVPFATNSTTSINTTILNTTELSNQDLNSYNAVSNSGRLFYAAGNNSVINKPSGINTFGMFALQSANNYISQVLVSADINPGIYYRTLNNNGVTIDWKKLIDETSLSSTLNNYVTLNTDQTITGLKTISSSSARIILKNSPSANTYAAIEYDSGTYGSGEGTQIWKGGIYFSGFGNSVLGDYSISGNTHGVAIKIPRLNYGLHILKQTGEEVTYINDSGLIIARSGFKKVGSSDSYVLLGGGGHVELANLGGKHEHNYLTMYSTTQVTSDVFSEYITKYAKGLTVISNITAQVGNINQTATVLNVGNTPSRFWRLISYRGNKAPIYFQGPNADNNDWDVKQRLLTDATTYFGTSNSNYVTTYINGVNKDLSVNGHTHSYFPLTGGNLNGHLAFPDDYWIQWYRHTDYAKIQFKNDADNDPDSYLGFETGDNGNEYFKFSGKNGATITEWASIKADGIRVKGTLVSLSNHTHNYLPLTGGTLSNTLYIQKSGRTDYVELFQSSNTNEGGFAVYRTDGASKEIRIKADGQPYFSGSKMWHADNDGSGSGLDADLLDGYHLNTTQNPFNKIPAVNGSGVMDVGRYIDFHYDSADTSDYKTRLTINHNSGAYQVALPAKSGTIALTTDIPGGLSGFVTTWTAKYKLNTWCKILKITGYSNILLNVLFSQSSQACSYLYLISTGYGTAKIFQLGANNFSGNSTPRIRVTQSSATTSYVEVYGIYGYNGATEISINCKAIKASYEGGLSAYTDITESTESSVKAEITSSYNKIVADLQGNADTASKLQTARSLWGQSFDGSKDISGGMLVKGTIKTIAEGAAEGNGSRYATMGYGGFSVYSEKSQGFAGGLSIKDNEGNFLGTIAAARTTGSTLNYIYFGGEYNTPKMVILGDNVGIGTVSPTYKLHVNGNANITTSLTTPNIYTTNIVNTDKKSRIVFVDSSIALRYDNSDAKSIGLLDNVFRPYVVASGLIDLGATNAKWKNGYFSGSVTAASFEGVASSAKKVLVNQHTGNDVNYPIVWCNNSSSSGATCDLYKSYADLTFNTSTKKLKASGGFVGNLEGTATNANTLDGLDSSAFVKYTPVRFSQHNQGTYSKILEFTINNGDITPFISFTWHPTECNREVWADFNITIRGTEQLLFYVNWKGTLTRTLYCVGDGTTYSVWVKGVKTSYDPYGAIQIVSSYNVKSINTGRLQYSDSEPTGTYKTTAVTSGICKKLGVDTLGGVFEPIYLNEGIPTKCAASAEATATTIAVRNGSGDLRCRLLRSNYQDQSTISGAIAYRVNNSTDDYLRFCSSPSAIRTWLGVDVSKYLPLTGGTLTGNLKLTGSNLWYSNDASLKIYSGTNTTYGNESMIIQTCFDNEDPATSDFVTRYANRCILSLQPRGGCTYIGKDLTTVGNTGYKLYVGGKAFSEGGFVKSGASDSDILLGGGGHMALSSIGSSHTHNYLPISGGTLTGALYLKGGGGSLNGNDLTTGSRQIIGTESGTRIYFGNPLTKVVIESVSNPIIKVGTSRYTLYHTGNKPTLADIGAAAASHTHGLLHDTFTVSLANTTTDSGWSMINSTYNGFILKSIRTQSSAPEWILGNFASGICFGGADTKAVISVAYGAPQIRVAGGNGTKPSWFCNLWHDKNFTPGDYLKSSAAESTYLKLSGGSLSGSLSIGNNLAVSGTATFSGTITPNANNSVNIGSSTKYFSGIYSYFSLTDHLCTRFIQFSTSSMSYSVNSVLACNHPYYISLYNPSKFENVQLAIGTDAYHPSYTYSSYGLFLNRSIRCQGSLSQASDMTKKDVINYIDLSLDAIANAPAFTFKWKKGISSDNLTWIGTSAQYWKKVIPESVKGEEGDYGLSYSETAMVSVISLARRVRSTFEEMSSEIAYLRNKVQYLENLINNP